MALVPADVMNQQKGTFWQGSDGNAWVAGDQGTNSVGSWDGGTADYWSKLGYRQTTDPTTQWEIGTNTGQGVLAPTSGTSGSSGTGTSAQQNLLRQGLNAGVSNLEGQLNVLNPQEQAAKVRVNDQYGSTSGRLNRDYETGQQNLQVATDNVNEGKERSLSNLRTWLQGMGMGYQNQLGAMGAGDSSATGLINFALGQQGSRERGGILQDAGTQLNNLDMQGDQLRVSFEDNMYDLDKWKADNLNQITMDYASAREEINRNILDARARAAAEMELTQQAVDYLSQLEQQYRTDAQNLAGRFSNISAGQNIDPSLTQFNYSPVAQAQLNPLNMPNRVNPESGITAFNRRRDDELLANPMGV